MSRRIWIAEGFASDGDIYGRILQLPNGNMRDRSASQGSGTDVQRTRASVLKTHFGDIPSCPCISAILPQDHDSEQLDQ
jgi:hypothetical protein